tara:strand:- start:2980 stop:3936 length:957 start_codon:yes stop_codon:yes gene_type:complete
MLTDGKDGRAEGGEELVEQWRKSDSSVLWLDIEGEPNDEIRQPLIDLGCDEFAITDSFRKRHPPKVEHFSDNSFILFRGISVLDDSLELIPQQIGFWVGHRHLITVRRGTSVSIEKLWARQDTQRLLEKPAILALKILHYACGRYLEKLLDFEDHLAVLEEGLLSERSEEGMKELVAYRSRLRRLRRTFRYHLTMAEGISKDNSSILVSANDESSHVHRDLYDVCERLYSLCSMYYELCGDLVEGHISLSSHTLNGTMKILTIISGLFVPLTFLAGIYGMNFEHMPELKWEYAYFVLLGVMGVLATGMLVMFRKLRWL